MAELEWRPCRDCSGCMVASDDGDEGWVMHATDAGFDLTWGSLELSCDASGLEQAKEEAAHLFEAVRKWSAEASERDRRRRHG